MKKYLAMLLACAMIFAFAAGCAQQNPANSDEPTATNAPTDVEATPVQNTELVTDGNETVSDKDTINIAVDREPATLNPGGVSSNVNEIIMRNVLDTLLKFDENAIPQANLATEWEAIDDLTWQFKLRDDVNFTNGEHFTAKDVVYSINRLANTTTGASALTYIDLSGVEAVDDYTVKIKTTKPYAFLEAQLCQAVMCIVNEKAITEEESSDMYVLGRAQNTLRYICFNTSVEPLNNVNVRKALYHATDTELIRETIYGEKNSEKANGPIPPSFPGKNHDLPVYEYDPAKAKEMLAAEGYENGFEVSFIYLANTTNNMFAEMLQSMWAEVGVTLVLQPTESGTLSTMLNAGEYEVGVASTDMKLCDAGEGLYAFFHSSSRGSSQDRTWLNDADVDAILDKIVTTLDAEERNKLVSEAEAMIHDLCPMIYICHPWPVYGVRSNVRGLKVLPYDMEYYSELYFVNED